MINLLNNDIMKKLLIVLGEGGHTTEMLKLVDLLEKKYLYSYLVTIEDNLSVKRINYKGDIYRVNRPRGKNTNIFLSICITFMVSIKLFFILKKAKPVAILSTGPAIVVPAAAVGKIFGIKIIFIETGSRVKTSSLTGKIMYKLADLYFIQWPYLKKKYPKAIYAGRLM
jgi:UDP-N-acetylglucosamine:LPS N-acetylglucosamine transferase